MHAHPMLTPLLPLRTPEEVEGHYSADAAAAYKLIWANTLAHLRSPREVTEKIHTYKYGDFSIRVRSLIPTEASMAPLVVELDGRRVARNAIPVTNHGEIEDGGFVIESVEPYIVPGDGSEADAASLIEWLDGLEVVSPGRLGEIFKELEDAGWVSLHHGQYRLTDDGEAQLNRYVGFVSKPLTGVAIARWKEIIAAYSTSSGGLSNLLAESNRVFGLAVSVPTEAIAELVTGIHTADEAYALRDRTALKGPLRACFPASMDPDALLPQDSVLRSERLQRESELSEGRAHRWLCLSDAEKASIRMGAILASYEDESAKKRFCESVQFDTRTRWLIGLGADGAPPSVESAQRAYKAWTSFV